MDPEAGSIKIDITPFKPSVSAPIDAADPLDRPKQAPWYVWPLVIAVHVAYLYARQYVAKTPGIADSLSLTISGISLTAPFVLSWIALFIQVGIVMGLIGRLRPFDLGLDLRLLGPALVAVAPLWILEVVDFPRDRGPLEVFGGLVRSFLGEGLLRAVVFQGFFLTQVYVALGRRYWDWDGARVAWAILVALIIASAVDLSIDWNRTNGPFDQQAGGRGVTLESLKELLTRNVMRWPYLFFVSCVFMRSGNLFFTVGLGTLYLGFRVRENGPSFVPISLFLQLDIILIATEWLRFRRKRAHRIDRVALGGLPLPPRLGDPLRAFWIYLTPLLILLIIFAVTSGFAFDRSEMVPVMILVWLALPRRSTNAFYLRAFSADEGPLEVRKAILHALGRGYRLSGIRSPKRRWPILVRSAARFVYCFHYASVRYMNLEAGDDWVGRLWRSLGDARCAFVDLSHVTEFVALEIRLAVKSLGLDRVMFVGDRSRSHAEWRDVITEHLTDLGRPSGTIHVGVWDGSSVDRATFETEVARFKANLPPGTAGLNWESFGMVRPHVTSWSGRAVQVASVGVQVIAGAFLCMVANQILRGLQRQVPIIGLVGFLGISLYVCAAAVSYLQDDPFPSSRRALGFYTFLVFIYTLAVAGFAVAS